MPPQKKQTKTKAKAAAPSQASVKTTTKSKTKTKDTKTAVPSYIDLINNNGTLLLCMVHPEPTLTSDARRLWRLLLERCQRYKPGQRLSSCQPGQRERSLRRTV
jgi:hypothetical protein